MDMTEDAEAWRKQRSEAARIHDEALRNALAAEGEQAAAMLRDFVAQAVAQGLAPVPLKAKSYSGGGRYATNVRGWYLRRDGSIGCDELGNYYVLRVQGGFAARLRGVVLEPARPPLIVGKGGRDGDAIDLKDLLALRLAEPESFPH